MTPGRPTGRQASSPCASGRSPSPLAALRLGAPRAVATDIDPSAIDAARAAAHLNRLSGRLDVSDRPLEEVQVRFQIVFANLRLDALIALAARFAPDGQLVMSGLRPGEEPPSAPPSPRPASK